MGWNRQFTLVWLLASIAITLGLTFVLWHVFGVAGFVGLLFLPFLWSGLRMFGGRSNEDEVDPWAGHHRPRPRTCPACGWSSDQAEHRYCPMDGTPLE